MKGFVMTWFYLLFAGLLEVAWAIMLKMGEGLGINWWSIATAISAIGSFFFLSQSLKKIPVSVAYPIWVGIGMGGVALFGFLFLREPVSTPQIGFLCLIFFGVAGLMAYTSVA